MEFKMEISEPELSTPSRLMKALEITKRYITRCCQSNICTIILFIVFLIVLTFVIVTAITISMHGKKGRGRAANSSRLAGIFWIFEENDQDDDEARFCSYDSDLIARNVFSARWENETANECQTDRLELFYSTRDRYVTLNKSNLAENEVLDWCEFTGVDWLSDDEYSLTQSHLYANDDNEEEYSLMIWHDFINISCEIKKFKQKENESDDYNLFDDPHYYEIKNYRQILVQAMEADKAIQRIERIHPPLTNFSYYNVLVLALDSVSQVAYKENFQKVSEFVGKRSSVLLQGYNVIGHSADSTLFPFLTGLKESELPELKKEHLYSQYLNSLPFLWNYYQQHGYVTLFAEDQANHGTFQKHFHGFEEPPTDHYMRPFWLAVDGEENKRHCVGSKHKHIYTLEYIESFFDRYENTPKFAFGFISEFEKSTRLDQDIGTFLQRLDQRSHLNDTIVIIIGDHGPELGPNRHTIGGILDERLPLALVTFPELFKSEHPDLIRNITKNIDKMTTAFDFHDTLRVLLDVTENKHTPSSRAIERRGINLFHPMPKDRTCSSADIDVHFCTCVKYDTKTNISDIILNNTVHYLVTHVNKILYKTDNFNRCSPLSLKRIISSKYVIPNDYAYAHSTDNRKQWVADKFVSKYPELVQSYIQITFQTEPGDGIFEGTVSMERYTVSGEISRLNMYEDQSKCIENYSPSLMPYCYCAE